MRPEDWQSSTGSIASRGSTTTAPQECEELTSNTLRRLLHLWLDCNGVKNSFRSFFPIADDRVSKNVRSYHGVTA
jgi:hypothetical protein